MSERTVDFDLSTLTLNDIAKLPDDGLKVAVANVLEIMQRDRRENQLLYYRPVSEHAQKIHDCRAKVIGVGGGNGASKTDTCLAEIAMMATGIFPECEEHIKDKFRGPINVRIVVESLTTVLHPIILPKMQWWKWSGVDEPGGDRGHWGWIPRICLVDGSWVKSWSEKLRILRVLCRDPSEPDRVIGESTIQFMSHDQDPTDFASGDFHLVLHDEPPAHAIWRENQARTMRVNGRMMLAMTWPDDPSINVDWLFDEVYEPGMDPNVEDIQWFNLYTTDNPNLNQEAVASQMSHWSDETRKVRIYGQPIRFSNRIHPLFTDITQTWCYSCGKPVLKDGDKCAYCGSVVIDDYNHVKDIQPSIHWPCVFVIDPHPRKPHMFLWAQIDPADDIWIVAEGQCDGDPADVRDEVFRIERELDLTVTSRIMDPNMGRSPASSRRGITWQDEFDTVGLILELGDDSDVGRARLNEYLKPDSARGQPRIHISKACSQTIHQIKRYVWDDYRNRNDRDIKQKPKDKYDDYPTMLKYLMNSEPTFRYLAHGAPIIRRPGHRTGAY